MTKGKGFKITAGIFFILVFLIGFFINFMDMLIIPFIRCVLAGEDILNFIPEYLEGIIGHSYALISYISYISAGVFSFISTILMAVFCFAKLSKKKLLTIFGIYFAVFFVSAFVSLILGYLQYVSLHFHDLNTIFEIIRIAITRFFEYFPYYYLGGDILSVIFKLVSITAFVIAAMRLVMMLIGKAKEKRAFFITAIVLSLICVLLGVAVQSRTVIGIVSNWDFYIRAEIQSVLFQNIFSCVFAICSVFLTGAAFVFLNIGEIRAISSGVQYAPEPEQFIEKQQSEDQPVPEQQPVLEQQPEEKAPALPEEYDIERKLHTLKRMHENGVISDEQYESSKKELLEKFINV